MTNELNRRSLVGRAAAIAGAAARAHFRTGVLTGAIKG
jgi:hypothetical protein